MSPTAVGFLLVALSAYSFWLIRRAGYVQTEILIPFLYRLHVPNVLETVTAEEHDLLHERINIFNIQIISCFIAYIVASCVAVLFFILVLNGGDARMSGYIMSILFAYLAANYNLGSKIESWVYHSENELLARVIKNKSDAAGFDTLGEYLQSENDKMIEEALESIDGLVEEFEEVAKECGFDPEKNYDESEESLAEFFEIMEKADKIVLERHKNEEISSEPSEK
jgi:hypothetical protein